MTEKTIQATFTAPNSSDHLVAAVSPDCTADYLVQQLVASGFMPPANAAEPYRLSVDGIEIGGRQTLHDARAADPTVVQVLTTHNGAAPADHSASRHQFDYDVVTAMACSTFRPRAYRSRADLQRDRVVNDPALGVEVTAWAWEFRIPTLVGPGRWAESTTIGVDTDGGDYPLAAPATWLLSPHVPYSPHFRSGAPVCIGREAWTDRLGDVTLGHLVGHIARLLNHDEVGRGGGYRGWNGAAIDYVREHFGGGPLDARVRYPRLPDWLWGDIGATSGFEVLANPHFTVVTS